jgi:putative peptidoglycan lipid II flippase
MRSSLASVLRGILLLSLPATVGLILLREPLVALLFQRGAFGAEDTQLVAWALLWYAAGLVGHSVVEIASRAFYALHDTRTPVIVGVGAMGLNVVLSLTLPALFIARGWQPHGGLALSNSFATFLEMLVLLYIMRRRLGGLEESQVLAGLGQAAIASLAMGVAIWIWVQRMGSSPLWLLAGGAIALGLLVYVIAAFVLRVPELQAVFGAIRRRLHR